MPDLTKAVAEALACPFCDSDDVLNWLSHDAAPNIWAMFCQTCGAEGPHCDDERQSAELWNRRPSAQSTDALTSKDEENERLKAERDEAVAERRAGDDHVRRMAAECADGLAALETIDQTWEVFGVPSNRKHLTLPEQATSIIRERDDAESRAQSSEADNARLRGALEDVKSHEHDWRKALENMRDSAPPEAVDADDASYWRHQLDVLDRIIALSQDHALSTPRDDEEDHSPSVAESAAVGSMPALPQTPLSDEFTATHRHVKRGTDYQFVGPAILQTGHAVPDYTAMAVYRGNGGDLWVRPAGEWLDGRFETLDVPVPRNTEKLPASELTDAELIAEQGRVEKLWDSMFEPDEDGEEFEGHGGSPGEWIAERMNEVATEQHRRADGTVVRDHQTSAASDLTGPDSSGAE